MEEHKRLIMAIVDNKLFNDLFDNMRREIALELLDYNDTFKIPDAMAEARAVKRLQQKLTEIANQVRMGN